MLDIVPAQLRAKSHPASALWVPRLRGCRRRRRLRQSEEPIDGGMATEALLVHVLVSKFCDFLPLCHHPRC